MRKRWHFPPGELRAADTVRLSLWRLVHLRRLDLILAIYGKLALSAKQRLWPKARHALTEAPRERAEPADKLRQQFSQLMNRLQLAPGFQLGVPNELL